MAPYHWGATGGGISAEPFRGRLFIDVYGNDSTTLLVSRVTAPTRLADGGEWASFSAVAEVAKGASLDLDVGVKASGAGEIWLGYSVIEHVTDEVPLTPFAH